MNEIKTLEFAYWTGVAQSDGYFKKYYDKKRKQTSVIISLKVGKKSLPMLEKFVEISKKYLNRESSIFKNKIGVWECHIGVKKLLNLFKSLDIKFSDPPILPNWVMNDPNFFGSYLAGLIDGDGDIRTKRQKYQQCVIRISSHKPQFELAEELRKILKCEVSISKRIRFKKKWCSLEFYVSKKNYVFIQKFVIPFIKLSYKADKLQNFINSKKNE